MGLPYFMVLSEGWIHNGFFQFFQVIGIRVRQCTVKILDQYIKICRMIRSFLHFQVAFPDRLRHSALTHILSDDNIACVNELLNLTQDFPKIDITATKACSSKQKNLLIDNEAYAKEILKQTSYYSLIGGYKDIFKNPTTKKYKDGTRFEDIVELYYFDELLRQLFLEKLETLQECKDLEWELMENENVYLKLVWEKVQSELKAKKTEIAGAEPEAEKMKTDADVPDAVAGFKERTNEKFHRIDGLGPADIESQVHDYVMDKIRDNGLDAEIIYVAVTGTRSRGIENKNSDIDVAVEYKGSIREDDFFDMLHEDGMTIAGIKLDINPITEGKTGTMENYLPAVEKHLEHKASDREKKNQSLKA